MRLARRAGFVTLQLMLATAERPLQTSDARFNRRTRPFLKWAGGKFRVLDEILPRLPSGERLIEPFAGSAVVSLNAGFPTSLVADTNPDLIRLYEAVRDELPRFIEEGRKLFGNRNTRSDFEALRDEFNASTDAFRRAVIFVYLNRHGFNGLCRYNSRGRFNVPFGKYTSPGFPEREIVAFHHAAKRMSFVCSDFVSVMARAGRGDVVYCDPPYVPLSVTANFTSYSPNSFGFPQQKALAEAAKECASRGATVLISNHDTAESRALYRGAKIYEFGVHRAISSKASTRGEAREILALYACLQSRPNGGIPDLCVPF
jgi:DNA adenine methylase